jgi:tRNA 2-thiouridine synthesizing protein D
VKFSVTVRAAPDKSGHLLALKTCQSLLQQGHELSHVFFYESAVTVASALLVPDQDELAMTSAWQNIQSTTNTPLYVCVAAALRRGIVNEQEAASQGLPQANVASGFEITGLGEWVSGLDDSFKQVTFA